MTQKLVWKKIKTGCIRGLFPGVQGVGTTSIWFLIEFSNFFEKFGQGFALQGNTCILCIFDVQNRFLYQKYTFFEKYGFKAGIYTPWSLITPPFQALFIRKGSHHGEKHKLGKTSFFEKYWCYVRTSPF